MKKGEKGRQADWVEIGYLRLPKELLEEVKTLAKEEDRTEMVMIKRLVQEAIDARRKRTVE